MEHPDHHEGNGRLARLEAIVESLADEVKTLAGSVRSIAAREGRPNWNMLGVFSTVVIALVGAMFLGPIQANQNDISEVKRDLNAAIQREMARNNQLEREMGEVQMINRLFVAGKLKLE